MNVTIYDASGRVVSDAAGAAYIIHPVVLVGISLLIRGWAAPALVKFAVTGTLACATSWILADPLVRAPGLRRIV